MKRLDPADLRAYAGRDWEAPARLSRVQRASQPIAQKIRLAVDLYEAARRLNPAWPDDEARREDLACHLRVRALLERAAHVGTR